MLVCWSACVVLVSPLAWFCWFYVWTLVWEREMRSEVLQEATFFTSFYNGTDTISHISQQCLGPLCAMRFVLSLTFAYILLGPASNIWHSRIVQALVDTTIRLGLVSFLTCSSNFVPCLLLHWLRTTIWTVPLPFWCFPIFAVDTVLAA